MKLKWAILVFLIICSTDFWWVLLEGGCDYMNGEKFKLNKIHATLKPLIC